MKRLAVFVEGYTEVLFVERLLIALISAHKITIESIRFKGGANTPRRRKQLRAHNPNSGADYFVLIVDCTGDETVKSRIREEHESLTKTGYESIIGIRDVAPNYLYSEIPQLELGLPKYIKTSLIPVLFVLAVMEVEAWFIAEHTHFARIDPSLTMAGISATVGFNPQMDDVSLRPTPASDLDACYHIVGRNYLKGDERGTIAVLDYGAIYLETKDRFPHLASLTGALDAFLS